MSQNFQNKKPQFVPSTKVASIAAFIECIQENRKVWTKEYRDITARAVSEMSFRFVSTLIKEEKLYYFNSDELKEFKLQQNG